MEARTATNVPSSKPALWLAAVLLAGGVPAAADTLQKVAATGVVTFGYRESSVPFSYLDGPHKPSGFGVAMYGAVMEGLRKATGR